MPFTLTDLRADVDALLANGVDPATWSTALKDGGMRQALLVYSLQGPAYEADVIVTTAGHEQDLSALTGLLVIETIAWPWNDGLLLEDSAVRWRQAGATTVRLDRAAPQAGDVMRVRYRRLHTIQGLDGAAQTTVPDVHRGAVAVGAAAGALGLRLRQISENPALPREAAPLLQRLRDEHEAQFVWLLERMQNRARNPVWAAVGL